MQALYTYEEHGEIRLAYLEAKSNGKALLKNDQAEEVKLDFKRLYQLSNACSTDLNTIRSEALELSEQSYPGAELHKLAEKTKANSALLLAQELHQEPSIAEHLAIYSKLIKEKVYFKRKGHEFFPRSAEEIEQKSQEQEKLIKQEQELTETIDFIKSEQRIDVKNVPDFAKRIITNVKHVAAETHRLNNQEHKEVIKFLELLPEDLNLTKSLSLEKKSLQFLKKFSLLENEHLIFFKYGLHRHYSKSIQSYTPEYDSSKRKDLTNLKVITIDDQSTQDMDDGISLEQTQDGHQLGIHISDVACLVPKDSNLDKLAFKRATSVYAPEEIFNMLPPVISNDQGSLVAEQKRPAVSILFDLNHNFKIKNHKIVLSLIKVHEKISYEHADELIEQEDLLLSTLYQISCQLETERITAGAIKASKEFPDIKLIDGQARLSILSEADFSRNMIAEFMVLANSTFANYAAKHFLPAFYRAQEESSDRSQQDKFQVSFTSLSPKPHHALALPAYLQATSPIRRYFDLCNQRQITTHLLSKQTCYDRKDLSQIKKLTATPLTTAAAATKEIKRFWQLKYLEDNYPPGSTLSATVVRNDKRKALVRLNEILITGLVELGNNVQVGSPIKLRLLEVDALSSTLKLEFS